MKVFVVISQQEDLTQVIRRYGAETIHDVIANLQIFVPEDEELKGVYEEHPSITVM